MAQHKFQVDDEVAVHAYKIGDVLEAQGARLKVIKCLLGPDGLAAYEMVSPFTKGEPWLVSERFLSTARKVRSFK